MTLVENICPSHWKQSRDGPSFCSLPFHAGLCSPFELSRSQSPRLQKPCLLHQNISLLTGTSERLFFPHSQILTHTFLSFAKTVLAVARRAPGIIVMANPDIIELQSDRATPAAARTITLRPGSRWKSCIREKPRSIRCWKVLADNVSITKRGSKGVRLRFIRRFLSRKKCNTGGFCAECRRAAAI